MVVSIEEMEGTVGLGTAERIQGPTWWRGEVKESQKRALHAIHVLGLSHFPVSAWTIFSNLHSTWYEGDGQSST